MECREAGYDSMDWIGPEYYQLAGFYENGIHTSASTETSNLLSSRPVNIPMRNPYHSTDNLVT
jgi:hypothetical protein